MKELQQPDTEIVIEWTGVGGNAGSGPGCDQVRRLARVLGKIAARRDLARSRDKGAGACQLSDSKLSQC
jgi:hypothetical protein